MKHIRKRIPFFARARRRRIFTSRKLETRLRVLDRRLDLKPGHGFAEVVMGDDIRGIIEGDTSCILDGWDMDRPEAAERSIQSLGRKWAKEDTKLQSH